MIQEPQAAETHATEEKSIHSTLFGRKSTNFTLRKQKISLKTAKIQPYFRQKQTFI